MEKCLIGEVLDMCQKFINANIGRWKHIYRINVDICWTLHPHDSVTLALFTVGCQYYRQQHQQLNENAPNSHLSLFGFFANLKTKSLHVKMETPDIVKWKQKIN